jgi:hypothetical protein
MYGWVRTLFIQDQKVKVEDPLPRLITKLFEVKESPLSGCSLCINYIVAQGASRPR